MHKKKDILKWNASDKEYRKIPMLISHYPLGPGVRLQPGEAFTSFRTFEILHDSDDRERKGLARRKMYRTVAPQITENPTTLKLPLYYTGLSETAKIREKEGKPKQYNIDRN